jgi:hypothetical protein
MSHPGLLQAIGRCAALATLLGLAVLPAADEGYDEGGRAGFGAFVVPPSLDALAQRDLDPGDGGIILHVRPGSTAESLGLQPGDIIRSINDTPIQSFRDVRQVLHTVTPGDIARVVVTGSDGTTRLLDGPFKARQPRRWAGGPPPWAMNGGGAPPWVATPDDLIGDQRQELIAERQRLAAAAADLAAARQALGPGGAWACEVDLRFGDPLPADAEE